MESLPRKAQRVGDKNLNKKSGKSVRLQDDAARLLKQQAKKLRLTEQKFASAAITYFAETGLDPTAERPGGMADLSAQMSEETRAVRQKSVDVGNHLISILRWWEKHLYAFLQQQQAGTLNYLEQIENGILRHQVAVENTLLYPMAELLVAGTLDANLGWATGKMTNLRVREDIPQAAWPAALKVANDKRDQQLATLKRTFQETHRVPKPVQAPKPVVASVPAKVLGTVPAPTGTPVIAAVPK